MRIRKPRIGGRVSDIAALEPQSDENRKPSRAFGFREFLGAEVRRLFRPCRGVSAKRGVPLRQRRAKQASRAPESAP